VAIAITQAELKYWSEANLFVSLSLLIFHHKLYSAREDSHANS